ncbi:hypothetical protein [Pontibacter pamirensis]|uniref:hypothetical protein n=1 Tax=Pontibacter pamirensis TaxID=2562824 RepID=UPI001389C440|nr:hypothetical protein [Pontibacter pamirensis]
MEIITDKDKEYDKAVRDLLFVADEEELEGCIEYLQKATLYYVTHCEWLDEAKDREDCYYRWQLINTILQRSKVYRDAKDSAEELNSNAA